jgi:hypothetical protein
MPVDNPVATLLYGGPGTGKTATAVGSFWDWKKKEMVGKGKYITFGRENNPALRIPEECRRMGEKGGSLRFTNPTMDSFDWVNRFEAAANGLLAAAKKGNTLDALVIDGMSEFDLLYEMVYANQGSGDKFAKWDALLNQCFAIMQKLDPEELGCDVFVTARVMERKKERRSSATVIPGDPEWINFDYYPSMRGSFRLHFPHYFNLVLYMETQMKRVTSGQLKGKSIAAHVMNMVRTGDIYVKNQWEFDWMKAGLPLQMVNPDWPKVKQMMDKLQAEGGDKYTIPTGDEFEVDPSIDLVPEEVEQGENLTKENENVD